MRRNTLPPKLRLFRAALFGATFLTLLSLLLNLIPCDELAAGEKSTVQLFEHSRN